MITCPKCGRELADGARFCKFCGSQVLQTNMQNNTQRPVQNIQVTTPAPKKKKSSKGIIIAIIAVLLVALIVLGVIFIPDLLGKKKGEDLTDKEKLTQLLEESTTKPIVEFVYDDYDSDGTYEAYAVVGETDEEDEKHPEFYDADIYFVNHKKAQPIKENVSGQVNGTMKVDDSKYISIEVYNDGTDEGKSFIYTADGTKSDEADISGKYSRVHKENGRIVGFDDNGREIEIEIIVKKEETEVTEVTTNKEETSEVEITTTQPNGTASGIGNAKVGDYITFGSYEQDNNTSNGKEEVEWLVLDKRDGKILVISKYALVCQMYNEYEYITWENCTLRSWLNNEFINTAFTLTQRSMIPTVTVSADANPDYNTDSGNNTQDKVFLLSINEVNKYFSSDSARKCKPTAYAEAQGAYTHEQNCNWWLHSPGYDQLYAAYVSVGGGVNGYGDYVDNRSFAVRPALWINL